jgi:hypothetical protein
MKFLYHRSACTIDSIFRQTNLSRATKIAAKKLNDGIVLRAASRLAALLGSLLAVSIAVDTMVILAARGMGHRNVPVMSKLRESKR